MPKYDVIIIGSGLSGIHAAYPIVQAGLRVAMLDVGTDAHAVLEEGLALTFEEERRNDPGQQGIFLGTDLSGIPDLQRNAGHAANMTSGRREYITRGSEEYAPLTTQHAAIVQSFAAGGLSEAWGAACSFFDEKECEAIGIPFADMKAHYDTIIERVGVSGTHPSFVLQPPARADDNSTELLRRYAKCESRLRKDGFVLEQPALALLTENKGVRQKTSYRDMDFWDNIGRSVYRGHYTLEELITYENFSYIPHTLVRTVAEQEGQTVVEARDLVSNTNLTFSARSVIMAAGALNTTRIILRSFNIINQPVPFLLKNNYLVPCLLPSRLGKVPGARHSLCQLALRKMNTGGMEDVYTQLYSYNSLLLQKLLPYIPLPLPEAFSLLAMIAPAVVLADIRFSSATYEAGAITLRKNKDSEEHLEVIGSHNESDVRREDTLASEAKRSLRRLGLVPLSTVRNPFGSASHYAGGVPYAETPLATPSVNAHGQLHGAERIFIADSAAWRALPAKSPGLTLMANANRIGTYARDMMSGRS